MKRLLPFLLLAAVLGATETKTCVNGPLYRADGSLHTGTLHVSWPTFLTPDNRLVQGGYVQVPVVAGALRVCLEPNDTAVPAGTSYLVQYALSSSKAVTERWIVPTSAVDKYVYQVRTPTVPTPNMMIGLTQLLGGGAASGQVLKWTGSAWQPADLAGVSVTSVFGRAGAVAAQAGDYSFGLVSGTVAVGQLPDHVGDVTGTISATTVARIQGRNVANTAPANNQVIGWSQAESTWKPLDPSVSSVFGRQGAVTAQANDYNFNQLSGTAGVGQLPNLAGDVSGAVNATTVGKIQSRNIAATAPNNGQVLGWNGGTSVWEPISQPSVPVASVFGRVGAVTAQANDYAFNQISGTAGVSQLPNLAGDVSGAVDVTTVGKLQGRSVSAAAPANGQVIGWNAGTSVWEPVNQPSVPVASVFGRTGAVTAQANDYAFDQVSGTVGSGQLPNAGGDLSGTLTAASVVKLRGRALLDAVPSADQALIWDQVGSAWKPATLVTSAFGRTGAVMAQIGDYSFGQVSGTAQPAQGGTGAAAFTAGSIPFAGAGGVHQQDNASLFWNAALKRLGIGTNNPQYAVDVTGSLKAASLVGSSIQADGYYRVGQDVSGGYILGRFSAAEPVGKFIVQDTSGGSNHPGAYVLAFGSPATEKFRWTSDSKFGVGRTPGVALDVEGQVRGSTGILFNDATTLTSATAGGDTTGTLTNLTVAKIQGRAVNSGAPSANQVLAWDGSQWKPTSVEFVPGMTGNADKVLSNNGTTSDWRALGGDISGAPGVVAVGKIQGKAIVSPLNPANNQVLGWNSTQNYWEPKDVPSGLPSQTMQGGKFLRTDGTNPAWSNMDQIQGRGVAINAPASGQVLKWDGVQWKPEADLVGSSVPSVTGQQNKVLTNNGTDALWQALGGDISGPPDTVTVGKIQGRTVASTAPANNQVLVWNNATSTWEPQNQAGAAGEANTASNIGTGAKGWFAQKSGVDLQFKTFDITSPLSVSEAANVITLSILQASGTQSGYLSSGDWTVFNNKVGTSRTITAGSGLTGGGDLSADRTLNVATADTSLTVNADSLQVNPRANGGLSVSSGLGLKTCVSDNQVLKYTAAGGWDCADITSAGHTIQEEGVSLTQRGKLNFIGAALTASDDAGNDATKVTLSQSPASASLVGTGRLVSTGSGLTGGGDLSADRTLAVDTAVVPTLAGANAYTGASDYSGAIMGLPSGTVPPAPACDSDAEKGRVYIKTDAASGQQVYVCEGLATGWKQQGGGGTPGGINTQLQYNNNGAFGGAACIYNSTDQRVECPGGLKSTGTTTGKVELSGVTSGTVSVTVGDVAGTWTMTLPGSAGSAGQLLQTNGAGVVSWVSAPPREIGFILGAENGSALVDADDQPTIWANRLGQSITIQEVWCESDGGTPQIQLQKDDGTPVNMLSANLSCSTAGASTTGFVAGENVLAGGDRLDFIMVAAGGTAKRVTLYAKYTL